MGFTDVFLMLVYVLMGMLLVMSFVRVRSVDFMEANRMTIGMGIKLAGAVLFLLIYEFYFGYGGDSRAYYDDAMKLKMLFFQSPKDFFQVVVGSKSWYEIPNVRQIGGLNFHFGSKEFVMDVIVSPFTFLGLSNYYATTIVFAFTSFFGYWYLYKAFSQRYPLLKFWAFISVFCIPSLVIWGSGIAKENLVLALLGLFLYGVVKISERKIHVLKYVGVLLFIVVLIGFVKIYVMISLLVAVLLWAVSGIWKKSTSIVLRRVFKPIVSVGVLIAAMFAISIVMEKNEKLQFDYFIAKAGDMQDWHYKEGANTSEEHGRGSSYTLGEYEPTILGTAKMILPSVNVTLFRPYIWEANSSIVVFVALESLMLLLAALYIITRRNFYRRFRVILDDPFLMMMWTYTLILAFIVGFTSYNFGALDRYKIPLFPFYVFSMMVIIHKVKKKNIILNQIKQ